jgi:tetratricopeptide (TPR) repeat protein
LIAQAKAAVENEEFDKALVSLTQAVRLDPGSADALWELAALYDRYLQDRAQAEKTYRRFQETFPQDARARLVPAAPRAAPAVQAGGSRAEVRAPAKADTRSAVQIWADGLERQRKGDLSGAVALYRRALERDATLPSGWYNMGLAYKGLGELEPARDAFARAVALQPDMIQGHFMLAVTSRDMKDNAVALRHLDAVLKMDPNYPKAHLLLGLIYRDQNREDLARRHLERYVELVPDDDPSAQEAREWMMGR